MKYYRWQLDQCLSWARTAVHLGAGSKDPATLTSASLRHLTIYAVDPCEENLSRNPNPNKIVAWGHDIPLPDGSIDFIFSEYVMEHVENPEATLAEAHRLLQPGGILLWVAPNLWPYSGLVTRFTPLWFHRLVNKLLEPLTPRKASRDVFPTYFRANSARTIRRLLERTGFELLELYTSADAPHYTQVLPVVHQLAVVWHILMDRFEWLRFVRPVQMVTARKPVKSGQSQASPSLFLPALKQRLAREPEPKAKQLLLIDDNRRGS